MAKRQRNMRALRLIVMVVAAILAILVRPDRAPHECSAAAGPAAEAAGEPWGYLTCRDTLGEAAGESHCLGGPGGPPASGGGWTAETCLATFDRDGDGDVDLKDYSRQWSMPVVELAHGFTEPYACIEEGGDVPVDWGLQGGIHFYVTLRMSGFSPGNNVLIHRHGIFLDNGVPAIVKWLASQNTVDLGNGVIEIADQQLVIPNGGPGYADGREAEISFEVAEVGDLTRRAKVVRRITFRE